MDDAIAKGGSANLATLRFVDEEVAIHPRPVGAGDEIALQREEVIGDVEVEVRDRRSRAFSTCGIDERAIKIVEGAQLVERCAHLGEPMPEEMVIFTRCVDLLAWLLPKTEAFPRPYRFTVTQRLMNAALDLQETLVDAQSERGASRAVSLRAADARLTRVRLYLRLAHQWRWLSTGQYERVSAMVAEIGRLLGGWLKQVER